MSIEIKNVANQDYKTLEDVITKSIHVLSHNAACGDANESMKASQSVLNLSNALAVLSRVDEHRQSV
jgi:hypothetical protein